MITKNPDKKLRPFVAFFMNCENETMSIQWADSPEQASEFFAKEFLEEYGEGEDDGDDGANLSNVIVVLDVFDLNVDETEENGVFMFSTPRTLQDAGMHEESREITEMFGAD